ncbi:oligopeptide transport system substrate-binding protein [Desulfotomaculum arcticum]|uniref:Oligopeptide transport system substrate-binding protein n=1 Tax=Desulfotruncus arcticus DSM 17038 TaxID=1121424 RepID=A0A1I2XFS8_9FIRM|nr:ABC transporter substrate-binding protein [Desulfotruncus arcticus]SFH11526.1 oligopeptide transport system substrate-binding protein [Desulfotomaculum arcticum] [Desulfotruncus arcticus DSM 17038]
MKKILLALMILMAFVLTGCGGNNANNTADNSSITQLIRYNVDAEPKTLDPAKSTGLPDGTIELQMLDGLTRYDANQEIQPAAAEDWDISEDGLTYTFKLRDAKWSNGDPVTAQDFVYSWLRALAPETASEYAYQFFYIKGAEDYNSGEGKKEDVALKALDDKTLQVVLNAPAPQFLGLTAFQTYFPVNQKVTEGNPNWFADPKTYVCNGPFKMVSWEHNQKIVMEKNPDYWDAENVKLEKLEIYLIENLDTSFNMYNNGQLDMMNEINAQELPSLQGNNELKIMPDASVYFYRFNVTHKPFDDVRVRKALALAIDRQALVESVMKGGQKPAYAFVPFGFKDNDDKDYRENGGDYFQEDLTEAKKLLAEAGYPDGNGFPKAAIMFNTHENHQKVAEAIQQMWKKNLGIDVTIQNVEWQVYLDRQSNLDYDISRAGWSPDYLDPMSFIDMFVTDGGNNQTGWSNQEYDQLVNRAKSTGDNNVRMESMHQAEKILLDEMPIAPLFFYTHPIMIKENLKNVIVPPFATYADFKWAYVE